MKLIISKIDNIIWEGDALSVTVPGTEGTMTVLKDHMPLITSLKKGEIVLKKNDGHVESYSIDKGILEVGKTGATILL